VRTLRVGVVGSRSRNTAKDKALLCRILKRQKDKCDKLILVSGGCSSGADRFAEEIAKELNLGIVIYYPKVESGCSRQEYAIAAFARNKLIVEACDVLLAVWDQISRGTKNTIDTAHGYGKPVVII